MGHGAVGLLVIFMLLFRLAAWADGVAGSDFAAEFLAGLSIFTSLAVFVGVAAAALGYALVRLHLRWRPAAWKGLDGYHLRRMALVAVLTASIACALSPPTFDRLFLLFARLSGLSIPGRRAPASVGSIPAFLFLFFLSWMLFYALTKLGKTFGAGRSLLQIPLREAIEAFAWPALVLGAFMVWPKGVHPEAHPTAFWLSVAVLVAFPVALAEERSRSSPLRLWAEWYRNCVMAGGLGVGIYAAVEYVITVRPLIEGYDFYFYICYARDLAQGAGDVPLARYRYFPGVYTYWTTVVSLTGGALETLQWAYIGLFGLNLLLVSALVFRATRNLPGSVYAGLWYAVLCSRFEGFFGVTELLTTIPLLLGLLLWCGEPFRGWPGAWRVMALGSGLGLALYSKQQGGLLSLGALSLLMAVFLAPPKRRHQIGHLLALPLCAAGVFLVGILLEGHGLEPLRWGLEFTEKHQTEGRFLEYFLGIFKHAEESMLAGTLTLIAWLGICILPRFRFLLGESWVGLVGFAALAAAATLIQFTVRAHHHYFLLTAPLLVVSTVVMGLHLARRAPEEIRESPFLRIVLLLLVAFPLFQKGGNRACLRLWPISLGAEAPESQLWRLEPDVTEDINSLRGYFHEGEDLLILPPCRNEIHLMLGTRSITFPVGYSWYPDPGLLTHTLRSEKLKSVLVLTTIPHSNDQAIWEGFGTGQAVADLPSLGFHRVMTLHGMDLWRRGR